MSATPDQDETECPLKELLGRLGEKWSLLTMTRLHERSKRFGELLRDIDGISHRVLTRTLRRLERDGLVARTVHTTAPPRVEYALTPLGVSLYGSILDLQAWAVAHHADMRAARQAFDRAASA